MGTVEVGEAGGSCSNGRVGRSDGESEGEREGEWTRVATVDVCDILEYRRWDRGSKGFKEQSCAGQKSDILIGIL